MEWVIRGHAHVLGDDIPHDSGVISFDMVTARITDPEKIIPHLFAQIDPDLIHRIRPGDIIVGGKNFLAGKAHNTGLLGMKFLHLTILCESMGVRAFQGVVATAIPCLTKCHGIAEFVKNGDELEVNFLTGQVINLSQNTTMTYPGLDQGVQKMIEKDGLKGMLKEYLDEHPELRIPLEERVVQ
jgi:3-isopropylmalate/(R)-2-methylmalate dehydratase small subunit